MIFFDKPLVHQFGGFVEAFELTPFISLFDIKLMHFVILGGDLKHTLSLGDIAIVATISPLAFLLVAKMEQAFLAFF